MLKKIASTFLLFLMLSAPHLKGEDMCSPTYCGGFNIGITASHQSIDLESFLTIGYFNNWFLVNFGFNYEHFNISSEPVKEDLFSFLGEVGLRYRLCNNIFFTYGAHSISENKGTPRIRYAVGAFVGLDYQITRHFLLTGKIDPYNFTRDEKGDRFYASFETGSLGLFYVF